MTDYEEKILVLLVESYRKSKKDTGTSRIARRTKIEPVKLYKHYRDNDGDLDQIEAVNRAAENCRKKGYITYEMNGFSNEIAAIYLMDDKILEIERYLSDTYSYEPKHAKQQYIEEMLEKYDGCSPAADRECERLRSILKKNRIPKEYLQTEDILKALTFIENNQMPLYLREASMLIYGNSKYLEETVLENVCRLLREFRDQPCGEGELPDEILREYHIVKEPQKICIKGSITIWMKEGRNIDAEAFENGIEFFADEWSRIERIEVRAGKFMTVENYTSYLRMKSSDCAFFYLGGYTARWQRDFLKKIYEENRGLCYLHFGDIDAGGFYIYDHLRRVTGIPFRMYRMSVETLQDGRYASCLQALTENDRKRLQILAGKTDFRDMAAYMLENNVKLEQEIVSLDNLYPKKCEW